MPAIAWALLATRVSGALLLLLAHGLPGLAHWYQLTQADDPPLALGGALALGAGLFAQVVCLLLVAAGLWSRLACLPIALWLGACLALGYAAPLIWLLVLLFCPVAVYGPGALTLRQQGRLPALRRPEQACKPGQQAARPSFWNETRTL